MSFHRPSRDPKWHSSQARSIERLSRVLSVLATPLRWFWCVYYRIVGRPKPIDVMEWTWEQMRNGPFPRKILPPIPITNDELDRLDVPTMPYWDKHAKPHGKLIEKPVASVKHVDYPVSYTIPIEGRIPNAAFIWNQEKGYYDVYEEGKPPRILPDPWPDVPKTVEAFLAKYPPISAEERLARYSNRDAQASDGAASTPPPRPDAS